MALITRPPVRDLRERATPGAGWTAERVEMLRVLWVQGLSCSQIARQLGGGATRCSVIGKAHRMGWQGREKPSKPARVGKISRPRPRLVVGGAQAHRPKPRPPRAIVDPKVWEALPGSTPRPFWERRLNDCKWPIDLEGETLSCCLPVDRLGYCSHHVGVAYQPLRADQPRTVEELVRSLRRVMR